MNNAFEYTSFEISKDRLTVEFNFVLKKGQDTFMFNEKLRFPRAVSDRSDVLRALRALHLALGISYYKVFFSSTILHPYSMSADEANFWNEVWRNGLSEFMYVNKLNPQNIATFSEQDGQDYVGEPTFEPERSALLGIGGGKDSIVAGELFKACAIPTSGFVLATGRQLGQVGEVSSVMDVELLVVERYLDKKLLEVQNSPGAYKGHIPISLIFGLVGTVLALLLNKAAVVVANEASASIPRVEWEYGNVNHQWSKSFAFEKMFQTYIHYNISEKIDYFSAIRQLSSIAVAKLLNQFPEYYEVFTSDNSVFRMSTDARPSQRWSLESPKSLSSFILFTPWVSEGDLTRIFGRNFLNESALKPLFISLVGIEGRQPLDCVGTVEELLLSLQIAFAEGKFRTSNLMKVALEYHLIQNIDWQSKLQASLKLADNHAIPEWVGNYLAPMLQSQLK